MPHFSPVSGHNNNAHKSQTRQDKKGCHHTFHHIQEKEEVSCQSLLIGEQHHVTPTRHEQCQALPLFWILESLDCATPKAKSEPTSGFSSLLKLLLFVSGWHYLLNSPLCHKQITGQSVPNTDLPSGATANSFRASAHEVDCIQ